MLLRGVKMPRPVLGPQEIDMLRSKARNSGRGHGGVPLRNNYNGERGGRDRINYGPGGGPPLPVHGGRGSHRSPSQNGLAPERQYAPPNSYGPPPGWQPSAPPPPGGAGFGFGMPPPPPALAHTYGGGRHNGNYQQSGHRSTAPMAPHPLPNANYPSSNSSSNLAPPGPQRNRRARSYTPHGTDGGRDYRDFRGYQ